MKAKQWVELLGILMFTLILTACLGTDSDTDTKDTDKEREINDSIPEDAVVSINGIIFDEEDLQFYTFMEKVKIESNRYYDLLELDGEDAEKRNAYWDEQISYLENVNVQLNQMIELYAMRLLGEEKHIDIVYEKVKAAIDEFLEQTAEIETVQEMIQEYDRDVFDLKMRDYTKTSLTRDRVVSELEYIVKQDNPEASEEEINLILTREYEDLFMDHMEDLEVQVYLK